MRISVFGLGYVGAVSCGCLAKLGHQVTGIDVSTEKVEMFNKRSPPVFEPELKELFQEAFDVGNLAATQDVELAIQNSDVALICVGTPSTRTGGIDDRQLVTVCEQIRAVAPNGFVVIVRSTCLPNVHQRLQGLLNIGGDDGQLHYVYHPEFLREGVAVDDFFNPPKIVFGTCSQKAREVCESLYPGIEAPTFFTSVEVAAMVKYADNCFHAVKVTFGNEMGTLCREFGVDSQSVMDVFCADRKLNISPKYLTPGAPFGGSCLPKDLRAILDVARQRAIAVPLLQGSLDSNKRQTERIAKRISATCSNQPLGVIGLAFKEGTDDLRESPHVRFVEYLLGKGHEIKIFDSHLSVSKLVGANRSFALNSIPHLTELLVSDLQSVANSTETLLVNHRLSDATWNKLSIPESSKILDLVGVGCLVNHPGYEGLYW